MSIDLSIHDIEEALAFEELFRLSECEELLEEEAEYPFFE